MNHNAITSIMALWRYLGRRRRVQFGLLFILMIVAVFAEIISIGAVIPFLTALTTPEALLESESFKPVFSYFEIVTQDQLLLPLTLGFVAVATFATIIKVLLLWANARLSLAMGVQLRTDLYTRVLNQPYEYHVMHNSSELISMNTVKVSTVIHTGIIHVLMLASSVMISIAIIATLLWVDIVVALSVFIVLGGGYTLANYLTKAKIKSNSYVIADNQSLVVKYMQEGIGGIRDVIMGSNQYLFSKSYAKVVYHLERASIQNSFLSNIPKPSLELMGIILISLLAYWLQQGSDTGVLPILGALALGLQRLLPNLQQIYSSWSTINGAQAVLSETIEQLSMTLPQTKLPPVGREILLFKKTISLQRLSFHYKGHEKNNVLHNIDLKIVKGSRIGFIGETGSGKSTLLDIIMGLLEPTQGHLLIDGIIINQKNHSQWQANIAHVPQAIFLSDASLAENIAFGLSKDQIDLEQVKFAAKHAQIAHYIEALLDGYDTLVGERGVRLSGGQRQRIGIARALYKKADVIVFDEATSALDTETEKNVMQAIHALGSNLTIIMIAHRLSTLEECDVIHQLDKGKLVNSGSYNEIIQGVA